MSLKSSMPALRRPKAPQHGSVIDLSTCESNFVNQKRQWQNSVLIMVLLQTGGNVTLNQQQLSELNAQACSRAEPTPEKKARVDLLRSISRRAVIFRACRTCQHRRSFRPFAHKRRDLAERS